VKQKYWSRLFNEKESRCGCNWELEAGSWEEVHLSSLGLLVQIWKLGKGIQWYTASDNTAASFQNYGIRKPALFT